MSDIPEISPEQLCDALAAAGASQETREALFDALRRAHLAAPDRNEFRDRVRWPLIAGILANAGAHRVRTAEGVEFEVSLDSRIERALLLSLEPFPDHVWEPQTTKLLVALGRSATNVIIGGAYIGDHALLVAAQSAGRVHAFEPMEHAYAKLLRNIAINRAANVIPRRMALWSRSGEAVVAEGDPALVSSRLLGQGDSAEQGVPTISIDDYIARERLSAVELIMLDTEGSEEEALRGAEKLLRSGSPTDVVFEIHRSFVDWSAGLPSTSIVRLLTDNGFSVFAIRDYHDNQAMTGEPVELIPTDAVYLEGPPHGFNMLATRNVPRIERTIDVAFVRDVSPKLLHDRDPRLHQPLQKAKTPA
jgi:FkbM family methyltransferase